eukprot:7358104-Prymnesium_polylepis.2
MARASVRTEARTVGRQEGGRAAQRGWNVLAERVAARPKQHRVEQQHAHGPQGKHRKCRGRGGLILVRIARQRQVGVQVATRRVLIIIVLERLAQKGPEDPRRCAWHADAHDKTLIAPLAATLQAFSADEAHGTGQYDGQWPGRADPDARAVVTQAGGRHHKDAFELRRDALVEAHQLLDLVAHPGILPDGPPVASPSEQSLRIRDARIPQADRDDGTAADRGEEDEKQRRAHEDHAAGGHVAAV